MAGSIRESGFAEPATTLPAAPVVRDRRWDALRRAARARLAPFGAAVLLAAIVAALAAPLLAPYDPLAQDLGNVLARPGRAHLLGTDNVGRDVLSRVIWGTRVSLVAGFVSVAIAAAAGGLLGLLAGPPGRPPAAASWGSMINAGRGYLQQAPWIVFGPGAALFVTVVGLNFVGDAIRDGLDPRLRG